MTSRARRNWTPIEDVYLVTLVGMLGLDSWKAISARIPNRTARQCRERWKSYLSPDIKNGPWTHEEDLLLVQKYNELGPKWVEISKSFDGRSDNNVKNRWYSSVRSRKNECFSLTPYENDTIILPDLENFGEFSEFGELGEFCE